jgi:D-3-phosphoglycerate dehydrogenase / 2-oxoglutarate reductase
MNKIFVSTAPFGETDSTPIKMLDQSGLNYVVNPLQRKLTAEEVGNFANDCDGLIAGTEDIRLVLKQANQLKMVSRVGIGLDSVPLEKCKQMGIKVSYTPDAVTMAVAELTIGLMIDVTRKVNQADRAVRKGDWNRLQGARIGTSVIGLIGFGRIGQNVGRLLSEFNPIELLVNDLKDMTQPILNLWRQKKVKIRQVDKDELYQKSDIISLHTPLSGKTRNMINKKTLSEFKSNSVLINTARGGIVNESDLFDVLKEYKIAGAAVDAFDKEPYDGPLSDLDNILLTQHMGSCSYDCRAQMEIQATEEVIRFFEGRELQNEVPTEEYLYQLD